MSCKSTSKHTEGPPRPTNNKRVFEIREYSHESQSSRFLLLYSFESFSHINALNFSTENDTYLENVKFHD